MGVGEWGWGVLECLLPFFAPAVSPVPDSHFHFHQLFNFLIPTLPDAHRLLGIVSAKIENSPHLEFYLLWSKVSACNGQGGSLQGPGRVTIRECLVGERVPSALSLSHEALLTLEHPYHPWHFR